MLRLSSEQLFARGPCNGGRALARRATAIACNRRAKPSTRLYGVGWAEIKNAPVPIQGQMRENTSAVPPCLTRYNSPTSTECRHTRSPLTLALRRAILMKIQPHVPRALGGPFAGSLRSSFQPRPDSLCVRCRFDLRLNGFNQFSTIHYPCQYWSCFSLVFPSL